MNKQNEFKHFYMLDLSKDLIVLSSDKLDLINYLKKIKSTFSRLIQSLKS